MQLATHWHGFDNDKHMFDRVDGATETAQMVFGANEFYICKLSDIMAYMVYIDEV